MLTPTPNPPLADDATSSLLIPLIRTAATLGFAIAPCSLGFVIIAASEHLIRSIMVGDDPEMLMSNLQNQFPDAVIEANENQAGLVAKVVDLIEGRRAPPRLSDPRCVDAGAHAVATRSETETARCRVAIG
jgi:hypothetical protein